MSVQTNVVTKNEPRIGVKAMVQIAMLAAVSVVLMLFEIPLPFAPSFYKLDLSEVPVLVGAFVMGPVAGAVIELIKILVNLLITGTTTAGVGEFANFLIGCSFCVPAGMIYRKMRSRKGALIGMGAGTVFMAFIGCFLNAYLLLPTYAAAFEMPIDALVGMGSAINPAIDSLMTFVIFAVAPFNLLKGVVVSLIVLIIYKKISPIFRLHQK